MSFDTRRFVSRLYLRICSNRDDVMLGAAKDFWRLHPEITDTDTLLAVATDKLDLVMNSSVALLESVSEFREIVRNYTHDMFPYYLPQHVDEIEAFVRSGSRRAPIHEDPRHTSFTSQTAASQTAASQSFSQTAASQSACFTKLHDEFHEAPTRPPRPSSFTDSIGTCNCSAQFVDSTGKLYMSDTEGVVRWCDASRFGATERWRLIRENISLVPHSRTKGVYTATAVIREKVWIATDGMGVLELWPGFPRHKDVRAIDLESIMQRDDCVLKVWPRLGAGKEKEAPPGRLLDVLGKQRITLEFSGHPPGKVLEVEYKRVFVMYALG